MGFARVNKFYIGAYGNLVTQRQFMRPAIPRFATRGTGSCWR